MTAGLCEVMLWNAHILFVMVIELCQRDLGLGNGRYYALNIIIDIFQSRVQSCMLYEI